MNATSKGVERDIEAVHENGWSVGTVLVGDEGHGLDAIRIEFVGRSMLVCSHIAAHRGGQWEARDGRESSWTLSCRLWRETTDDERRAIEATSEPQP